MRMMRCDSSFRIWPGGGIIGSSSRRLDLTKIRLEFLLFSCAYKSEELYVQNIPRQEREKGVSISTHQKFSGSELIVS